MKKLISVLALSTVIVSCSFTQAFAQSESSPKSIQKQLTQLEQQTNVEFVDVEELPEGTPIIYFDSVEELPMIGLPEVISSDITKRTIIPVLKIK